MFFYLFTFVINLCHWKFITADVTAVFVNNQHGIQRQGQDFDTRYYQRHKMALATSSDELLLAKHKITETALNQTLTSGDVPPSACLCC